ncbi:hypothetical protein BOTBODRAFT_34624 [Botryobasidium botryosum FD-172 SS1]|uniref:Transcription activator of gluconeogenesis ERT1 n=1 Tax=Botryobasidium botryosum (strain FD-172 SS1) TaxID=930990 RepID=A0A067MKH0_BOTB1|nr:hypothetical protein BOTBODRAFT_34624 [Botryobasidium botryosum FD-172 SS1]
MPHVKAKRRQVKNACTSCQKACKKCDDVRPCTRCVKYGIGPACVDSQRKERKKGVKRGPYKKRDNKVNSDLSEASRASLVAGEGAQALQYLPPGVPGAAPMYGYGPQGSSPISGHVKAESSGGYVHSSPQQYYSAPVPSSSHDGRDGQLGGNSNGSNSNGHPPYQGANGYMSATYTTYPGYSYNPDQGNPRHVQYSSQQYHAEDGPSNASRSNESPSYSQQRGHSQKSPTLSRSSLTQSQSLQFVVSQPHSYSNNSGQMNNHSAGSSPRSPTEPQPPTNRAHKDDNHHHSRQLSQAERHVA